MYQTPIHALPAPDQLPAGVGPDVPLDLKALADALDPKLTPYNHGNGTPAVVGLAPGKVGRRYRDDLTGTEYLDIGAAWVTSGVPPDGSITNAKLGALAVTNGKIADGEIYGTKIPDNAIIARMILAGIIDASKIANTLKPSAGAAAATEALRALGTVAGTAAAGNDSRLPTATEKGYLDSITVFMAALLDDPDAATHLTTLGFTAAGRAIIARAAGITNADVDPAAALAYAKLALADAVKYSDMAKDANGLAAGTFHAYRAATQGPAASGYEVVWNAEAIDVSGWHNPATGRFTPQVAGYYDLKWLTTHLAVTAGKYLQSNLYKNGALHRAGPLAIQDAAGNPLRSGASTVVKANGTTDYFSVFAFTDDAAGIAVMGGTGREDLSHFCGHLIGRST
jgi:hypothetical protein